MRLRWSVISLLAFAACAPKQIPIEVKIVTAACDAKANPFEGVQFLRVRVTGDGLAEPLEAVAPTGGSSRQLAIPAVPAGKNRVVEVRGFDSDPASGGKVLSIGRSLPFEVADVIPDPSDNKPIEVTIFLRKVNTFSRPSSDTAPTQCLTMKTARAGHTATLLKNGKVFIAGGYNTQGTTAQVALSETEMFNPNTGAFESSPRMALVSTWQAKAFHTATLLKSGQVLLWGGETYTGGVNNHPAPAAIVLVFDPDYDQYGALPNRVSPPPIPRTGHQAAVDANGKVLIVGGGTRTASAPAPLVPAAAVEYFDPATNLYQVVDTVSMPRFGAAALPVRGGEYLAVAAGSDGTAMAKEIAFFKWDPASSAFKQEVPPSPPRLADPGRRAPAVATLRDGAELLVLGGYSDPKLPVPLASSEIVSTATSVVSPGPSVGSSGPGGRGELCAAQLPDGKVIVIGGLTVDGPGPEVRSDGSAVIISPNAAGGASVIGGPSLPVPRYQHTCTALQDGTVLVLGGVNWQQAAGTREILNDAWIFQPAPTTP